MIRRAALLVLLGAVPAAAQPEPPLRRRVETRLRDARAILRPNSPLAPGDDDLQFIRRRSGAAAGVLGLIAEWLVEAGPAYDTVLREVTRAREAADFMDEDAAIAAITRAQRELQRVPR